MVGWVSFCTFKKLLLTAKNKIKDGGQNDALVASCINLPSPKGLRKVGNLLLRGLIQLITLCRYLFLQPYAALSQSLVKQQQNYNSNSNFVLH